MSASGVDRRARVASGVAGAALVAQLLVLRAVSWADETSVILAGREFDWGCSFRAAFGIPCPNCGMTRSIVMALDGELSRAFQMNPAGPLAVLGVLLLGAALIILSLGSGRGGRDASRPMRRLMAGAAGYGGLVFVVLLANWVRLIS